MIKHYFTIYKKCIRFDDFKAELFIFAACDKTYGENCQYQCSPLCINQTCDRIDGTCLTSCKERSSGEKCIARTFYIYFLEYLIYKYLRFCE